MAEESNNNIKEVISDFNLTELVDSDSFTKNEIADEYETLRNDKDEMFVFNSDHGLVLFSRINSMKNNTNEVVKAETSESSFDEMIENLFDKGYIPEGYRQTSISLYFDDMWVLNFEKESEYNVLNPYDSVKIAFDAVDGSLLFYKRFSDFTESICPNVSEADAIETVKDFCNNNNIDFSLCNDIKLEIVKISDFRELDRDTFVLVYKISSLDGSVEFWVNAETLDIELINSLESYDAKCFYALDDSGIYDDRYRRSRAENYSSILSHLGYSSSCQFLDNWSGSRTTLIDYINGANSWAFTFSGHGLSDANGITSCDGTFSMYPFDVSGVWSFVVLDCCDQGNATWANAFGIYDYNTLGRSFIGWYESIPYTHCKIFSDYFKSAMLTNTSSSVLSNVNTAIANIPGDDYYYVRYIGDRTTKGYK